MTAMLRKEWNVQVAEAQQAAQQAKQQVQEQSSKLQEVQRQAAEAKNEAGPLLRQSQQKDEQVSGSALRRNMMWHWKAPHDCIGDLQLVTSRTSTLAGLPPYTRGVIHACSCA